MTVIIIIIKDFTATGYNYTDWVSVITRNKVSPVLRAGDKYCQQLQIIMLRITIYITVHCKLIMKF